MAEKVPSRRIGSTRPVLALVVALLLSGVLLFLQPSHAEAHDNVLTSSDPPASATLTTPPERVVLNFRWRVQPRSAVVTVVGPDGATQWQHGEIGTMDRTIGVALRDLGPAGRYEVRYQGVTGWGYPFHGAVAFILAPAPASATPAQVPVQMPGDGPDLPLAWIAAVLLLTTAGTFVGVRLAGK